MESSKTSPEDDLFAKELEKLRAGKVSEMSDLLCSTPEDLGAEVKKQVGDMPEDLSAPVREFRISAIQSGVHEAVGLTLSVFKKGNDVDQERVLSWANSLGRDLFEKTMGDPDLLEEGPVADGVQTEKRVLLVKLKAAFRELIQGIGAKYKAEQARKAEEARRAEVSRKEEERRAREKEQKSIELDPKSGRGGRTKKGKQ